MLSFLPSTELLYAYTNDLSLPKWWEAYCMRKKPAIILMETFLRSVDALHCRESTFMLTFIKESRDELRDTHKEIEREQEVLRDTSDLLASKRLYGDPDEWTENLHEMNAVDEYLKKRNNGEIGGLGILSFEDEHLAKSHKKAKKKDKHKNKDRSKSSNSSRSDALSIKIESQNSELFNMENELILDKASKKKEKKEKKDKKDKRGKKDSSEENADLSETKEKKHEENTDAPKTKEKKHKKNREKGEETTEKKQKEPTKDLLEDVSEAPDEVASEIVDETKEKKAEEKARKREEKAERKRLEKEKKKNEEAALEDKRKEMQPERERSAPLLNVREQSEIEKETNELMKEFITRQATDVEQRNQFEAAMMRKLAKRKNPHAAEADKLLKQQAWADEAVDREKAAYEAKMMEKVRSRREKSGLSNKEMSSLDEPGATSEIVEKQKKEKKKKRNKDKKNEDGDETEEREQKEKKKKKKKDKDKEKEREED